MHATINHNMHVFSKDKPQYKNVLWFIITSPHSVRSCGSFADCVLATLVSPPEPPHAKKKKEKKKHVLLQGECVVKQIGSNLIQFSQGINQ